MSTGILGVAPFVITTLLYIEITVGIMVYITVTVNKFLRHKRVHNDLLREINNRMDKK